MNVEIGGLVTDFISEFQPLIEPQIDRSPSWFAVRFVYSQSALFLKFLDIVGLNYRNFTYTQKQPREKPITRSWFPGYLFAELDLAHDHWQQIYSMPGFLEILGRPSALPDGMIEALDTQLMRKLAGRDPGVKYNPGDGIVITAGPFQNNSGIVSSFDQRKGLVEVQTMVFNRPTKAYIAVADVRVA